MIFIKIKDTVSYRVALGGITAALATLCMFLSGIIPILYIALPVVAGILMIIIVEEISINWAFLTYAAVGILSIFITFDKEAALMFILIFGYYPILKYILDRIKMKSVTWLIKFLIFSCGFILYFLLAIYLLGAKELLEQFKEYGKIGTLGVASLLIVFFYTYEKSLDIAIEAYRKLKVRLIK